MVFVSKRWKALAMLIPLLLCSLVAVLCGCQVYAPSWEEGHAAPSGPCHGEFPGSTGHGACMLAVLPSATSLVWFVFVWFGMTFLSVRLTPPALLPFIPPKMAIA